jgi:hypothetical protein
MASAQRADSDTELVTTIAMLVTRVGHIELRVPQDRQGRFRTEVFERYQRSAKALVAAMLEMYVQGDLNFVDSVPTEHRWATSEEKWERGGCECEVCTWMRRDCSGKAGYGCTAIPTYPGKASSPFWLGFNELLTALVDRILDHRLQSPCYIGSSKPLKLGCVIEDYVLHMQYHLDLLFKRPAITQYSI